MKIILSNEWLISSMFLHVYNHIYILYQTTQICLSKYVYITTYKSSNQT